MSKARAIFSHLSAFAALTLFAASSSFACLLTEEEFNRLPVISQQEIDKTPRFLIFRGVVYNMDHFSKTQAAFHKRTFQNLKKQNKSQIPETDFVRHNDALPAFLKNNENAVGRTEDYTYPTNCSLL